MKEQLIHEILNIEWEMFSNVNNRGGKASCQTRPKTFGIMRKSQYLTWSEEILSSYLDDLRQARAVNRNLCTEKYGYMMEYTVPEEYEKIKAHLPAISEDKRNKIKMITDINQSWHKETEEEFPALSAKGRPVGSEEDSARNVSAETYLFCELKTYSEKTIGLLYAYTLRASDNCINLARQILENTVRMYGYASLQEAEESFR